MLAYYRGVRRDWCVCVCVQAIIDRLGHFLVYRGGGGVVGVHPPRPLYLPFKMYDANTCK